MLRILRFGVMLVAAGMWMQPAWGQYNPPDAPPQAAPLPPTPPPATASHWPVQVNTANAQVTIFQPQLDDFQGDQLTARAAVSVQMQGQTTPVFGAVWLQSRVATDRVARTVQILDNTITKDRFPVSDPAVEKEMTDAVQQVFAGRNVTLSLDQLLAMVETIHKEQAAATQIESTPPNIIFLDHLAVKVQYDGQPKLVQADNSTILRVVNTPFFVALDGPSRTYYLKGGGRWFSAPDPMGPFQGAAGAPPAIAALADSSGYQDPQQPIAAADAASVEIVTATEPTELICTNGQAEMATIPGTDLLYVTNTDSDVFLTIDTQQLFVLLSGRWYTAASHNGPWSFVPPDKLPTDFSRIPPNSDKSDVLAHVPNTQEATDAVADTYVPQTAAVDLHNFDQPPVQYDGDPQFQPVEGTDMTYAVNTDASVLLVGGHYYTCYNAVWYDGAAAVGPWEVCTTVPTEIYTIPPSCPIYPVRFVYCYGHTADVVYCGYLPGYVGCYAYNGVVVYGTGFRYHPWLGRAYYPRPFTFGFAAHYNWYSGHWGFDFATALGGGRVWIGNAPGGFVRGGGLWFGFGGFRPVFAHDALHATFAQRELALDAAKRDAYVRNVYDRRADVHKELAGPVARDEGRPGVDRGPAPARDDVFADRDGNVYRKTVDGWQTHDDSGWHAAPAAGPARTAPPEARAPDDRAPAPRPPEARAPEEHPAPPADSSRYNDLNDAYRARAAGDERQREAPPQAPPPPPADQPRGGGGRDNGGGGGGPGGNGGGPGNGPGGRGR
ncbi:MAG: hypothetical protein ABSH22_16630 [Tepidisphaeraceae bacterium]